MTTSKDQILNLRDGIVLAGGRGVSVNTSRILALVYAWEAGSHVVTPSLLRICVRAAIRDAQQRTRVDDVLLTASICCLGHALAAALQANDVLVVTLVDRGRKHLANALGVSS